MIRSKSVAWIVLATAVAAASFSPVFEPGALVLPLALVLLPVLTTGLLFGRRPGLGRYWHLVAAIEALAALTLGMLTGGRVPPWEGLREGAVDSWARTLDSTWPTRGDADLVLFVPLLALLAVTLALEVRQHGGMGAALLPSTAVLALAQAFSAARGWQAAGLAAAYVIAAVGFVMSCRAPERTASTSALAVARRGLPRALTLLAALALFAPVLASADPLHRQPYSLKDSHREVVFPSVAHNPLDEVAALLFQPDQIEFRLAGTVPSSGRVTLAELTAFDGSSWTTPSSFVPLGTRLPRDRGITVPLIHGDSAFKVEGLRSVFLPEPGRAESVTGLQPAVDPATSVLVSSPLTAGLQYAVRWTEPEAPDSVLALPLSFDTPAPPRVQAPPQLVALAEQIAGHQPLSFQTALSLEAYLRENYRRAEAPLPAGHGFPQLLDFLLVRKSGTSEQFASAYAVLAQQLGMPVRLAVGFRLPAKPENGAYVVRSGDAFVWPEVRVGTLGWVPLDPSNTANANPGAAKRSLAQVTQKARSSLPSAPVQVPVDPNALAPVDRHSTDPWWKLLVQSALAAVAVLGLVVVAVPAVKALRRRRRRGAPGPAAVTGAWLEARDALRDAGARIDKGSTVRDLRSPAVGLMGDAAGAPVASLAEAVDVTLWSGEEIDRELAKQAWRAVDDLRGQLRRRPIRARVRAAVTPRGFSRPLTR